MSDHAKFDEAMVNIYLRAKKEVGYNATIFFKMVNDRGGLETAKFLINASKPSDGYTALWERDRLDLTVEALVVEDQRWHDLFDKSEIDRAKGRLTQYHYKTNN